MADLLNKRRERAIAASGALLEREGFSRLTEEELKGVGKQFIVGWSCPLDVDDRTRRLMVVGTENFPSEIPEFFLDPVDDLVLKIPHLDAKGKVCVLPDHALFDQERPAEVVEVLLRNARQILLEPELSEFAGEFNHYWILAENIVRDRIHLVDSPSEYESEAVAFWNSQTVFFGKSNQTLNDWIVRYTGHPPQAAHFYSALVCRLNAAISPANFPRTVRDVQELLKNDPVAQGRLEQHLAVGPKMLFVLLIQLTDHGAVFGGIGIHPTRLASNRSVSRGFRPGKVPPSVAAKRSKGILSKKAVKLLAVQRADHGWIHTRGGDGANLSGKRVTIVGAGSLGGYVAHLVARAGVSAIEIVDPDNLSWDNVGRHVLGGREVGQNKATALGKRLEGDLPHLKINSHANDWRTVYREAPAVFMESDLIVSTVANWSVEHDLNFLNRQLAQFPPVVFGWIEPYAVAGHCLAVLPLGGCFACGTDSMGAFQYSAATFPRVTTRPQPGGCGVFQQYGPTGMTPIAAMIADCSISILRGKTTRSELWTWLGSQEILNEHSGVWTAQGRVLATEGGTEKVYRKPWKRSCNCKRCA